MDEGEHGSSGGVKLTEEQLEGLVDEAERGYDPDGLRARSRRGRPPLGAEASTARGSDARGA